MSRQRGGGAALLYETLRVACFPGGVRLRSSTALTVNSVTEGQGSGGAEGRKSGVKKLIHEYQRLINGVQRLINGVQRLINGVQRLINGVQRLINGVQRLINEYQRLINGDKRLINGDQRLINGDQRLINGDQRLINGVQRLINGVQRLINGVQRLINGVQRLIHYYSQCPMPNSLDLLHKSKIRKNPTAPKLRFVSPPEERGGVGGGVLATFARGLL